MFAEICQSRLKKFAVPTLLMSDNSMMEVEATIPAVPVTSEAVSESTSPDVIAIPSTSKAVTSEDSPRKHGLRLQIRSLKRKLEFHPKTDKTNVTNEDFIDFCKEHSSSSMANFIELCLQNSSRKSYGYRYTNEFKQFALTIYILSPNHRQTNKSKTRQRCTAKR
ncbi:uncharacterized protein LOC115878334 [Sitophilus oryzae]|uniref:Uncharacterized protein LOC115878334 n=1 Tax=Sitophilus oryzae TaxID=7048 RepID=A0A6J2XIC2_SITOR|nr:uncharacterized protein LOC115878334 [Sitophilus oryzae]